jgi:hypothetical protein
VWFRFEGPGWRYGSLLDTVQNPKPAYYALDFLTDELEDAAYDRPVSRYPELRGYAFTAPDKRVWVLWAPDELPHAISLPSETLAVYDKYGNHLLLVGGTVEVKSPVYVELTP